MSIGSRYIQATNARDLAEIAKDPRVESAWDEGEDGLWFSLKAGFRLRIDGTHGAHEVTGEDLRTKLREVEPCNCPECRFHLVTIARRTA
jgi:hypothetical protein